jgi:hypothetical protein
VGESKEARVQQKAPQSCFLAIYMIACKSRNAAVRDEQMRLLYATVIRERERPTDVCNVLHSASRYVRYEARTAHCAHTTHAPTTGQPRCATACRIWWVTPVRMRHATIAISTMALSVLPSRTLDLGTFAVFSTRTSVMARLGTPQTLVPISGSSARATHMISIEPDLADAWNGSGFG